MVNIQNNSQKFRPENFDPKIPIDHSYHGLYNVIIGLMPHMGLPVPYMSMQIVWRYQTQ